VLGGKKVVCSDKATSIQFMNKLLGVVVQTKFSLEKGKKKRTFQKFVFTITPRYV